MQKLFNILIAASMVGMVACSVGGDDANDKSDDRVVVASVDGRVLTEDDVRCSMPEGLSGADSTAFVRMFVDNWVLKQLKMHRAEQVLASSYDDIDRLVEDYRQSLIMRRLDQYYVDQSIDLEITPQQIASYYRSNAAAFRLDHHKVRGVVVRVPRTFRNTKTLTTALSAVGRNGISEVGAIAEKHNLLLSDMSGEWVSYSDFLSYLPTERSNSYESLLSRSGVQQLSSSDAIFHFIILDVARKGDIAPMESVEEDIRRRLYSERRAGIVRGYEEELRREAVEQQRVDIVDTVLLRSMYYVNVDVQKPVEQSAVEPIIVEEIIEEAEPNLEQMDGVKIE